MAKPAKAGGAKLQGLIRVTGKAASFRKEFIFISRRLEKALVIMYCIDWDYYVKLTNK
jgi:hypothetical protein